MQLRAITFCKIDTHFIPFQWRSTDGTVQLHAVYSLQNGTYCIDPNLNEIIKPGYCVDALFTAVLSMHWYSRFFM